jgi:hypothetical protein
MARYGRVFKERAVARLLPPESSPVEAVSREMGVSTATLERWRAQALSQPAGRRIWTAALDVDLHQRPSRRAQWPVPGSESQSPRLPQHADLHDHDLYDRQPGWTCTQIHLKRRGASFSSNDTNQPRCSSASAECSLLGELLISEYFSFACLNWVNSLLNASDSRFGLFFFILFDSNIN